jgi:hypothetical protein
MTVSGSHERDRILVCPHDGWPQPRQIERRSVRAPPRQRKVILETMKKRLKALEAKVAEARPDPDRGAGHSLGESQERKGGSRRVRERMPGLLRRAGHVLCWQLNPYPDKRFAVTHPRLEPCAGIPPARIWAGGGQQ